MGQVCSRQSDEEGSASSAAASSSSSASASGAAAGQGSQVAQPGDSGLGLLPQAMLGLASVANNSDTFLGGLQQKNPLFSSSPTEGESPGAASAAAEHKPLSSSSSSSSKLETSSSRKNSKVLQFEIIDLVLGAKSRSCFLRTTEGEILVQAAKSVDHTKLEEFLGKTIWTCFSCFLEQPLQAVDPMTCTCCGQQPAQWECQLDEGWEPYPFLVSQRLEQDFFLGRRFAESFTLPHSTSEFYNINFCTMTQVNERTFFQRHVRRMQADPAFVPEVWDDQVLLKRVRHEKPQAMTETEMVYILRATGNPVKLKNATIDKKEVANAAIQRFPANLHLLCLSEYNAEFPITTTIDGKEVTFSSKAKLAEFAFERDPYSLGAAFLMLDSFDKEDKSHPGPAVRMSELQTRVFKNSSGAFVFCDDIAHILDKKEKRMALIRALTNFDEKAEALIKEFGSTSSIWFRDTRVKGCASGFRTSKSRLSKLSQSKRTLCIELASMLGPQEKVRIGTKIWTKGELTDWPTHELGDRIYLVKGIDAGRNAWYYVLVKGSIREFLWALDHDIIHLEEHGDILYSAYGDEPPEEVTRKLKEDFNIDSDGDILSSIDHLQGLLADAPKKCSFKSLRAALFELLNVDVEPLLKCNPLLKPPTREQLELALEEAKSFALHAEVPGWPKGSAEPYLTYKTVIHLYTMESPYPIYALVNAPFNTESRERSLMSHHTRFIALLLTALKKLPEQLHFRGTLYRGFDCVRSMYFRSLLEQRDRLLKKGQSLYFAAFSSASQRKNTALQFAKGIVFVLNDVPGFHIHHLSKYDEQEVLIAPPFCCEVESVDYGSDFQSVVAPDYVEGLPRPLRGVVDKFVTRKGNLVVQVRPSSSSVSYF